MEQPPKRESPVAVAGLHKSFGEQTVLAGINFELESGKVTCVLGRSGTGKSVLLKLLIGLESPDAGSVRLVGQDLSSASPAQLNEARKKVGFLFQQAALYDSMSIGENVAFPLRRHTTLSSDDRLARVHQLLASVGMDRDLDKMPADLSGGMRKRVGLARALALDPVLVMFDEPTAGLDPITAAEIADLIVELREKHHVTSIVVTHNLRTAKTVSDRLIVLNRGKILFDGTFDGFNRSDNPFIAEFVTDAA
ncbi:MAG: ATP-binding cassette domain-containing protein [Bryobacteraceae bacterium]|jgi:phospholipid/cholesterol/gamma-HCH transport system ATP-binding protein